MLTINKIKIFPLFVNQGFFVAERIAISNDGSWTNPRNFGPEINFGLGSWGPCITPDNKYLFYSTGTKPDYSDVYVYWVRIDGLILVNPPYKLKSAKGMTPGVVDYIRYIGYYIFAPHVPVVNMAGDPSKIENEVDRIESEARNSDPLLVKYFSMRYMSESKKIMDSMVKNSRHADYPLLLLYGENDMIVDKAGCDEIYSAWNDQNKNYEIINGGSHGKSTVLKGSEIIMKWVESL